LSAANDGMSAADYLIILVCVASAGFGFWRGFIKEALSLVTWLAAVWLAWRFSWVIEPLLGRWTAAGELKIWVARAVVFLIVLIAGGLAVWLARELVRRTGLSSTDRSLGALFGAARGVLIVGLVALVLQLAGIDQDPWWQRAKLRPLSDRVAAVIRYYAELGSRYLQEQELVRTD
jgi:membrane protein required for colicin V production